MSTLTSPPRSGASTQPSTPASGDPHSAPQARPRRSRLGGTLLITCVAVVLIALTAFVALRRGASRADGMAGPSSHQVTRRSFAVTLTEKGELQATRSVDVKCEVEGRSTIIWLIPEGTEVKKGDLLVKIASNEIDDRIRAEQISVQNAKATAEAAQKEYDIAIDQHASDIRKAQLALNNAEIELNKYLQGDYQLQLLELQLALEVARRSKQQSDDILEDSEALAKQNFITPRDLENRRLDAYKSGVEVEKAQKALDVFQEYDFKQSKQQKESDVEEARKELERTIKKAEAEKAKMGATASARQAEYELTAERLNKFLEQKQKTEIVAPADGLVVYFAEDQWRGADRQIAEGSEVYERQTIVQLPDTSAMKVDVRIHEAKTNKIAIGQRARVEIEGIPGVVFNGHVTKIAPLADSQNRWLNPNLKEYDTEITLDLTERELKPGVTSRVEILVREVRDVLAVPVQAVYSRNGKSFAFKGKSVARAEPVEIETGYSSDQFVEVRGGLGEGDYVVLAQDETLIAKLPEPMNKSSGQLIEEADALTGAPAPRAAPAIPGNPNRGKGGEKGKGRGSRDGEKPAAPPAVKTTGDKTTGTDTDVAKTTGAAAAVAEPVKPDQVTTQPATQAPAAGEVTTGKSS